MKKAGQIVLFRFPQTDLTSGKPRPALLLGRLPGMQGDWLLCMISTQTRHFISGFDEMLTPGNKDFASSGLKEASLIRVGRLAVVEEEVLLGAIGEVSPERLQRAKSALVKWLQNG